MRLTQIIEALLFASDAPLSAADLARVDERLDEDTVQAVIEELRAEYDAADRSFSIYEVAGGYQLLTRPEFVAVLERYETVPQPARLSSPALEVLAIIAYRQPIGRAEVEEIRGVSSSGVLKTLQDRHLVEAVGRAEGLGRPLLYGTTPKFLEHFGFRSLEDLPRPDELPVVLRARALEAEPAAAEDGAAAGTAEGGEAQGAREGGDAGAAGQGEPAGGAPGEATAGTAPEPVPEGEPAPVVHPAPVAEEVIDLAALHIAERAAAADPEATQELEAAAADPEYDVASEPPDLAVDGALDQAADAEAVDAEIMRVVEDPGGEALTVGEERQDAGSADRGG